MVNESSEFLFLGVSVMRFLRWFFSVIGIGRGGYSVKFSPAVSGRLEKLAKNDQSEEVKVVIARALALYESVVENCRETPGVSKIHLADSDGNVLAEIILDENYQFPPWLRDMLS